MLGARDYAVELSPTQPGPYRVLLPLPSEDGRAAAPFALRIVEGAPRFHISQTGHGPALDVRAEGPVKLVAEGALPLRLSLDDRGASFRQFRFLAYLAPDAEGPVLVKLEVRERQHRSSWEQHVDASRAIVVQQALEPEGWQVTKATHHFDIAARKGYGDDFERVALGAVGVSAASLYGPAALLLLGAVRRPRDGFK